MAHFVTRAMVRGVASSVTCRVGCTRGGMARYRVEPGMGPRSHPSIILIIQALDGRALLSALELNSD